MSSARAGFTLIEVAAVVVMVGLLAGAAAVSFARPVAKAREREATDLIRSADAWTRQYARRFGVDVTVVYDISRGEVHRDAGKLSVSRMPAGVRLAEVWTHTGRAATGVAEVGISSSGLSRTYAVRIVGAQSDRWLVAAGLSGQFIEAANEAEVADILRSASARPEPR